MKNTKLAAFILAGVMALSLVACNSMESDAKKVAKRAYEIEQIYSKKWDTSNFTRSDDNKIREYMNFTNKMYEKHGKDREGREKFNSLVDKELKKLQKE